MDFRIEHPRPELARESWMSLNGVWDFEIDNDKRGLEAGFEKRNSLNGKINVPFCPESRLSGVEHTDFIYAVWYRKELSLPASFEGKRVLLHVEACDYATKIFVNGILAGEHRGGYTPFAFDITDLLRDNSNYVTVYAEDDPTGSKQAAGKQSHRRESYGCFYTRTTGIWQSVWLEAVDAARVDRYFTAANISNSTVTVTADLTDAAFGKLLKVTALYDGNIVGEATTRVNSRRVSMPISLSELHLWELGCGRLYDLKFELSDDGKILDAMNGYFGMREVRLSKDGFYLNGERIFGRFVLDQGFYPDGIYTAPSDDALAFDIKASMSLGFNGARLHQKVFEPRFLYHADRLGYMVFDEAGNWGLDWTDPMNVYNYLPEWLEEMERDMPHPSVIGWCPFNETWDIGGKAQSAEFINLFYNVTSAIDPTRVIITNSGSYPTTVGRNTTSDSHDVHDYEQDPVKFREYYAKIDDGIVNCQLMRTDPSRQVYDPEKPIFVSEYGGIKWVYATKQGENTEEAWGYGNSVKTEDEFLTRLEGLTDVLLENEYIFGYCYTQLTDVEQEQNGLLTYDRIFKFRPERIKQILAKGSVLEK